MIAEDKGVNNNIHCGGGGGGVICFSCAVIPNYKKRFSTFFNLEKRRTI